MEVNREGILLASAVCGEIFYKVKQRRTVKKSNKKVEELNKKVEEPKGESWTK